MDRPLALAGAPKALQSSLDLNSTAAMQNLHRHVAVAGSRRQAVSCRCSRGCIKPETSRLLTMHRTCMDTPEMAELPNGEPTHRNLQSCQPASSTVPLMSQARDRQTPTVA